MLEQGGGAIVNVSSIATRSLNRVPYGAAKGGVNEADRVPGLRERPAGHPRQRHRTRRYRGATAAHSTQCGRAERAGKDRYQQIVDQTVDSSLMKRYGTIDEQAGAILFSHPTRFSYITGVTLPVGGGDLG